MVPKALILGQVLSVFSVASSVVYCAMCSVACLVALPVACLMACSAVRSVACLVAWSVACSLEAVVDMFSDGTSVANPVETTLVCLTHDVFEEIFKLR